MFAVLILQLFLNKETIQMETVLNWITEYSERERSTDQQYQLPNTSADTLGWPAARLEAAAG